MLTFAELTYESSNVNFLFQDVFVHLFLVIRVDATLVSLEQEVYFRVTGVEDRVDA